jgi:hypothetical protein
MDWESRRYNQQREAVQPPNVFFDGTRLGLEGSMLSTLIVAGLGGLQIGLSVTLGYAMRIAEGLPDQAKPFALFGFIFSSILAFIALAMALFFTTSIPTMAYSMALVWWMLRWVGKRWGRDKLASTLFGAFLGLLNGLAIVAVVSVIFDAQINWAAYVRLFRWPAILSIDGIVLTILTLFPLVSIGAGTQIGWRLGKHIEEMQQYWSWY